MRAMIFAAGLGNRLKPITDTRPKALVTVGGKTMLEHIILKLKASGFNDIVINTHHFANQILAFLEANQNFGVNIEISDETNCLLDTGGGLEKASHLLYHPENMFTQKGETPYELIFENLNKGMDEDEIIEKSSKLRSANPQLRRYRTKLMKKCIHNKSCIRNHVKKLLSMNIFLLPVQQILYGIFIIFSGKHLRKRREYYIPP